VFDDGFLVDDSFVVVGGPFVLTGFVVGGSFVVVGGLVVECGFVEFPGFSQQLSSLSNVSPLQLSLPQTRPF